MTEKLTNKAFMEKVAPEITHLVCSASFESRSETIASVMKAHQLEMAAVLFNVENEHRVGAARQRISSALGGVATTVSIEGSDPIRTADELLKLVHLLAPVPGDKVLIDISAMMRETLLILLGLLRQTHPDFPKIRLAYNSANYPDDLKDEHDDDIAPKQDEKLPWLSYGVSDVRSVVGYPGDIDLTGDRHLLILMGFEVSRAEGIIYARDPAFLSIGHDAGGHSTTKKNARLNQIFVEDLKSRASGPINLFQIYPDDAEETATAIQREIDTVNVGKPIVAAMNTKIVTCGAALAAWRNSSIELVYAQPALYNFKDYSQPTDHIYVFSLTN